MNVYVSDAHTVKRNLLYDCSPFRGNLRATSIEYIQAVLPGAPNHTTLLGRGKLLYDWERERRTTILLVREKRANTTLRMESDGRRGVMKDWRESCKRKWVIRLEKGTMTGRMQSRNDENENLDQCKKNKKTTRTQEQNTKGRPREVGRESE